MRKSTKKSIKKSIKVAFILGLFLFISPKLFACYLIFGMIDVSRNRPVNWDILKRYFIGNGILTWLLSPFNLFIDLISFKNKGIYQLTDLPKAYQEEISALLSDIDSHRDLIKQEMAARLSEIHRGMLFFKWYGDNLKTTFNLPCFHKKYQYIKTIGVSTFNKQTATSVHFGPLRISLRLLYNISPTSEGDVYIQVGGKRHHWKDNPLFIFDDTLQHQSVNYSEDLRHCMFVDLIRPTKLTAILSKLLQVTKFVTVKFNGVFYKKWVFLK